ncbi:MAG: hypothetical protein GTN62_08005 [Gemmatimonadales bacterium]|nr:hypothetical protein [Gemmatimonadales bacterium]NIN11435.1 hypothetical protein [Gemmatimonadales bacterium]NIN50044.1 hypothetical protein [Gemmatimonadales bacterium]NIP07508.1 hypothetical protein [Gemmatimonadales bacterium]NIR03150.1 hypothetical protein [Gemmatimonadales bacterium]
MHSLVRACLAAGAALFVAAAAAVPLAAQGVTSAAVRGQVVDEAGTPVGGATLVLINQSTGQRYVGISRGDGRYNIENVAVGGPYIIQARLLGFQPAQRGEFRLSLGQALELNLMMPRAIVTLEAVTVTAEEQDPLTAVSRTGTAGFVFDSAIRRLPTLDRNFTDFVITAPQVVEIFPEEGLSLAGSHRKMNNIQIDGVSDNDLFGLGDTGQPGGQVGAKSITLEAVKEYQILIAPFDVRQSGFAGGLVNAITRNGTNDFHGSAFWYYRNDAIVRDTLIVTEQTDTLLVSPFGEFTEHKRGFSFGGPLVRDKVMFFAAGEWQTRNVPAAADPIDRSIAQDSAQRVVDIFRTTYGVSAGTFKPTTVETPNRNLFGRLDFQLGEDHQLTLRHNHVTASGDNIPRSSAGFYGFTTFNNTIRSNTNSTVLQLNSTLGGGRWYNELRLGYTRIRDRRTPENLDDRDLNQIRPQIEITNFSNVGGSTNFNEFLVGGERFSHRNELDQDIFELDDALTFAKGGHTLTVGTHNEWISFRNLFFHSAFGRWQFSSLADLQAGNPSSYFVQIPYSDAAAGRPGNTVKGEPLADWGVIQVGAYAQDQWAVTPSLRITAGLRVDVPILLDEPLLSGAVDTAFGIRTDRMPSGNIHWAPRFGLNWDVTRNRSTVVRGGGGIFTGRPPYVWLSNAFTNTGREVLQVSCSGAAVPTFTASVFTDPPTQCAGGGAATAPAAEVNTFDTGFRFPQYLKASIGVDQRLPLGIIGTVELLYSRGINTVFQQELNIPQEHISINGERRLMFGTIDAATGAATPQRVDTNFVQVVNHKNASKDWSYSITVQFQKRFAAGLEFNAGYSYSQFKDLTSLTSSIGTSNFGRRPVSKGGNPNDPEISTSSWEIPHKITLSGTYDLPIPTLPMSLTVIYTGQSGFPYTWVTSGDANADGYEAPNISRRRNDIVYVPVGPSDFTGESALADYQRYSTLIESEPCLREARGKIPARNSCRNPWRNRLDASLRVSVGNWLSGGQHSLTLICDVFNVLNLINRNWGLVKTVGGVIGEPALQLVGYDTANDRGIYRFIGPSPDTKESFSSILSRWQMQIGLRYDF